MKTTFKVGDRVVCVKSFDVANTVGKAGNIIFVDAVHTAVEFDEAFAGGHTCGEGGKPGHCWWFPKYGDYLRPVGVRVVKRPAKAGEWVRCLGKDGYSKGGEVCKVVRLNATSPELAYVEWHERTVYGLGDEKVILLDETQYVVLENYTPEFHGGDGYELRVTPDGYRTVAELLKDGEVVKTAEAKYNPNDNKLGLPYSFERGAEIATDRLLKGKADCDEEPKAAFDWDAFKAGKIAVRCNQKQALSFLHNCELRDSTLHWMAGDRPTRWRRTDETQYIGIKSGHITASGEPTWYTSHGYTIVEYEPEPEAPKAEPEPITLYCVRDYKPGEWLTKGKTYIFGDGMTFDNGHTCRGYGSFARFSMENACLSACLVPCVKRPAKAGEWVLTVDSNPPLYDKGETGKVVRVDDDGTVKVQRSNGKTFWIHHKFYLVLDGYQPEPERCKCCGQIIAEDTQ